MARKAWRIARGTVMFVGLFGAKNVGGTSGSLKKEDVELEDALVEGPIEGFLIVERKEASEVWCRRLVN